MKKKKVELMKKIIREYGIQLLVSLFLIGVSICLFLQKLGIC